MASLKLLFLSLCIGSIEARQFSSPPIFEENTVRIRVYSNCQMSVPIGIGTPVQWFNLSIDFITPDTVLYMEQMDYEPESKSDPPVYNRKIFQPNESSTFHNYSKSFSDYVDGNGSLAADIANFPFDIYYSQKQQQRTIKNQMDLMLLTNIGWIIKAGQLAVPADGSLGLAPKAINQFGIGSFMQWLKGNKPTAMMTFYFNNFNPYDPDQRKQNSYAIVSFDEKSPLPCFGTKWFYASSLPIQDTWSLIAKSINIGRSRGKNDKFAPVIVLARNQSLMVQPAQYLTSMPIVQMNVLKKIVRASDADIPGIYLLPCNSTKFAPNLKFIFDDSFGQQLLIEFSPEEYILPSTFGDCQLIFTHNSMPKSTIYMLGYSFFEHHCLQLKYTKTGASVGLSPKKTWKI